MLKIGTFFNIFNKNWQKENKPLLETEFDYFELMPENEKVFSINQLKKIFKKREIIIHAPFVEANLISNNKIIRKASLKYYNKILPPLVSEFRPRVITLHIGYSAFYYEEINLEEFIELSAKYQNIAVENMPDNKNIWKMAYPNTEKDFDNLIKKIKNKITFDVGHWFKQKYDVYKLIEKYSYRIANIHIHDIVNGKDHQPLGAGLLDVRKFLCMLKKINYNSYLTIELASDDIKGTVSSFYFLKKFIKNIS